MTNLLRRNRAVKLTALLILLVIAGAIAASVYFLLSKRPRPTKIGWAAVATTVAGDGAPGYRDGTKTEARFANLFGVVLDGTGNIYVTDGGDSNRVRKITPEGSVSTLAGGTEGFADGEGPAAAFNTPSALAIGVTGDLYVADTGNNSIRRVSPQGLVTTIAGDGTAGYRDGPGRTAQFNGPVGVAVDKQGNVYVADTYNDRIRKITPAGQVSTLAGGPTPGYQDGPTALFDSPCGVVITPANELLIADTGNNRLRKLTPDGRVTTFPSGTAPGNEGAASFAAPIGLALTHDGFLYVTENRRGRVIQLSPEGTARPLVGDGTGFANGEGSRARFSSPAGVALDQRGALYVADTANYLVRKLAPVEGVTDPSGVESQAGVPRLTPDTLRLSKVPWPVDPQWQWHEVIATMGEVRGNYEGESRDHLHSGIDVQGAYGAPVRAIYDEKVSNPLSNWEFGSLNEGVRVGVMTYVHLRVGRNQRDEPLDVARFIVLRDEQGKPVRVRIKRGTRFRVGDQLGTINRMYHVHLNFGPGGAEINPLTLPFVDFSDHIDPTIERDGIQLFDQAGGRLTDRRNGRLVVSGDVSIVVDAYDQVDHNLARRRLGLYKLGYQVLRPDGTPAPGFEQPRINIEFNRMLPDPNAVKIAYAGSSGITVYGSAATRFLYNVTNVLRDGRAESGVWHTPELPAGDYVLRIIAADYSGNIAKAGCDLPITIK